jgi:hypothetical protein
MGLEKRKKKGKSKLYERESVWVLFFREKRKKKKGKDRGQLEGINRRRGRRTCSFVLY